MTYIPRVSLFVLISLFFIPALTHAVTLTVTNLDDSGPGSLRQAILDSNATPGVDDEIVFQEGLTGVILITPENGEMEITDDVTITGPLTEVVIDADATATNDSRIFNIDDGDDDNDIVVSISRLTLVNGLHPTQGGAIFNSEELTIESCEFEENTSGQEGGAIYNSTTGTITEINNSTFYMNTADDEGGAIYNDGSIGTIQASTFEMNEATNMTFSVGGAIHNRVTITTITQSTFTENMAGNGGAIHNEGTLAISQSTFTDNMAGGFGGAIDDSGSSATITQSTFTGNMADDDGGAIFGISSGDGTTITHSTFTGNMADDQGGAIMIFLSSTATITHSTFTGNMANDGGAIAGAFSANISISFATIVNNTANNGGGLLTNTSFNTITIKNSIVGVNSGGDCDIDDDGPFTGLGNNLDSDGTCAALSGTFVTAGIRTDPDGLQDNGGPTQTIALCTGVDTPTAGCAGASPALNTVTDCTNVDNSPATTDQRFFPRPYPNPGMCDIGAFEDQPTGKLAIIKESSPPGGIEFEFTGTGFPEGCELIDFTLFDEEMKMCILPLGTYTVEEAASIEYETEIVCTEDPVMETDQSVTIDIEAGDDVTCTFKNTSLKLDIAFAGTGGGTVNVTPPDQDCEPDCNFLFAPGTDLTLTATPDELSQFDGFSGDGCGEDIMITEDLECTATFSPRPVTLNLTFAGTGEGTVNLNPPDTNCTTDCSEIYDAGTMVMLSATPDPLSQFDGFSGDEGCGENITITDDLNCTATFSPRPVTLNMAFVGNGGGTVNLNPPDTDCTTNCSEIYDAGTGVTLMATADDDSIFNGFSGEGCGNNINITENLNCTATFTLKQFNLTVGIIGDGEGTVTSSPAGIDCGGDCSEIYNINTVVTLTPTPRFVSKFAGWTGDPDCADGVVTMNADKICTAEFMSTAPNPISANLSVVKSGSPDPVETGEELTYTFEIQNSGPNAAPNVQLTDVLPPSVSFVSASQGCTNDNGTVNCSLSTFSVDETRTITIVVIPTEPGVITNSATVKSGAQDPSPSNNTSTIMTEVVGEDTTVLSVESEEQNVNTEPGEPFSITVDISNQNGSQTNSLIDTRATATGVIFSVNPGDEFVIEDLISSRGTCDINTLECVIGEILEGETVSVAVDALAPEEEGIFDLLFSAVTGNGETFNGSARVDVQGGGSDGGSGGGGCALSSTSPDSTDIFGLLAPLMLLPLALVLRRKRR